jgi:lipopolysaccharide/colanic/teichoic acid biosynthesis glycosyltransferase
MGRNKNGIKKRQWSGSKGENGGQWMHRFITRVFSGLWLLLLLLSLLLLLLLTIVTP